MGELGLNKIFGALLATALGCGATLVAWDRGWLARVAA